jgi:hypothetical protein
MMREERLVRRGLVLAVLGSSLMIASAGRALDPPAIEHVLRLQGRLSFALFIAALVGPGWHALLGDRASAWLARQRAALYLAFALSHLIHGTWVLLFFQYTSATFSWNVPDSSGVLAFAAIAVLLYAETPHGQRHVPAHARVEALIAAYVWLQFVGFFIDRMLTPARVELRPWYVLALSVSVVAAVLSACGRRQRLAPLPALDPADRR